MFKSTTENERVIEIWNNNEVKLTNFLIVISKHQGRLDTREALINAMGKYVHSSGNHVLLKYILLNTYKI